jgi:MFS transporter, PPP family, 3-phenylpropionic acid transporter
MGGAQQQGRPASPAIGQREHLVAARLAMFYAALFAGVGIYLPFWPVWLDWRGLDATEIG